MKPPVLLAFGLSQEKAGKVKMVCMRHAIRFQSVAPESWNQPLAALCGLTPPVEGLPPAEPLAEEMLVMGFFPPGLAQQFLLSLKRIKLPPVPLKAILTETNSQWNAVELQRELQRERNAVMAGQGNAHAPGKEEE